MNSRSYRRTNAQSGFLGFSSYLNITRYKKLRFHFSSPQRIADLKNEISASALGQKLIF